MRANTGKKLSCIKNRIVPLPPPEKKISSIIVYIFNKFLLCQKIILQCITFSFLTSWYIPYHYVYFLIRIKKYLKKNNSRKIL